MERKRTILSGVAAFTLTAGLAAGPGAATAWADGPALTDLTPMATVTTDVQGQYDSTFTRMEQTYGAPLTGGDGWRGFLRQGGRTITVTLPQACSLGTISIQMEQNARSGIYYPSQVDVSANVGGSWVKLGTVRPVIPPTDRRRTTYTFRVNAGGITAQQVRISFPVQVWVFARHLTISGMAAGAGSASPSPVSGSTPGMQQPLSPADPRSRGIRNMLLAYTGDHGTAGTWTPSDFLPMVMYQPPVGGAGQHLFDTVLFLPYGTLADNQAAWRAYLDDLFRPGQQLSALDAAVGQANAALGTPGYREKVVIALPYPDYGDGVWGAVGGSLDFNGLAQDPNALSARLEALRWYLQTLRTDWSQAGFQNLTLTGVYWVNEQVDPGAPADPALIAGAAQAAHDEGLPMFWIPFYDAPGADTWSQAGFDAAWLQPNFIEQGAAADPNRIAQAEQTARRAGLGVEVELTDAVLYDPNLRSQYLTFLGRLRQDGFGSGVSHAYYAGSKLLVTASLSADPSVRALYDATAQFALNP
ncbi:DUF4855 domain-containing protein [Alicyclobacillus sp.]|uniref:DUF4855 domain-containing protein n=1 Tax=Alicyclobacillus sp. TaxID=61169 RepID=UPI0025B852FB|nr:DUF4855 domain-containing protein [Alicyclobacillus sp.]MCL6516922.1 DUF4855 domain-containing protein [Alicyclobacillus sp.]